MPVPLGPAATPEQRRTLLLAAAAIPLPPIEGRAEHLLRVARLANNLWLNTGSAEVGKAAMAGLLARAWAEDPALQHATSIVRVELNVLVELLGIRRPGQQAASGAGAAAPRPAAKARTGAYPAAYAQAGAAPPTATTALSIIKRIRDRVRHIPAAALEAAAAGRLARAAGAGADKHPGLLRHLLSAARERCEDQLVWGTAMADLEAVLAAIVPDSDEGRLLALLAEARRVFITPLARRGWSVPQLTAAVEDVVLRPLSAAIAEAADAAITGLDDAAVLAVAAQMPMLAAPFDWDSAQDGLHLEAELQERRGTEATSRLAEAESVNVLRAEQAADIVHALGGQAATAGWRARARNAKYCLLAAAHEGACHHGQAACHRQHPKTAAERTAADKEATLVYGTPLVLHGARTYYEGVMAAQQRLHAAAAAATPHQHGGGQNGGGRSKRH